MLPLDLHVLSLPLAFILSQDQTLHCKLFLFLLACPDDCNFSEINVFSWYFVVLVLVLQYFNQLSHPNPSLPLSNRSVSFGIAKVALFSVSPNFFCNFLHLFFTISYPYTMYQIVTLCILFCSFYDGNIGK